MNERIPTTLRSCPLECGRRFRQLNPEKLRESIAWHLALAHGAQAKPYPPLRVVQGGKAS